MLPRNNVRCGANGSSRRSGRFCCNSGSDKDASTAQPDNGARLSRYGSLPHFGGARSHPADSSQIVLLFLYLFQTRSGDYHTCGEGV
jgi:hypothetical protein